MNKRRNARRSLILIALVVTVISILIARSTTDEASEPVQLSATVLSEKETPELWLEPLTETPTEALTKPPTEPQTTSPAETQPPKMIHVATPLDTAGIVPDYAAEMIGRTIWGEAGGVQSEAERAAVAWCILNRVDTWGLTIADVVTAPDQFQGYRDESWGECPEEHIELATDVLNRWAAEKYGVDYSGRVLPSDYLYFWGDGERNYFSIEYLSTNYWDWSLTDPYI